MFQRFRTQHEAAMYCAKWEWTIWEPTLLPVPLAECWVPDTLLYPEGEAL